MSALINKKVTVFTGGFCFYGKVVSHDDSTIKLLSYRSGEHARDFDGFEEIETTHLIPMQNVNCIELNKVINQEGESCF